MPRATVFSPATNKGTSAPRPTARRSNSTRGRRELPQAVQREEHARRIGTAAAQAASQRNALGQRDVYAKGRAGGRLQRARCTHGEVLVLRHARNIAFAPDHAVVAALERDRVGEVDQRDQRFQRVITVRAPSGDVQEQIDLRGRGNDEALHLRPIARSHGVACAALQRSTTTRTSTGSASCRRSVTRDGRADETLSG